MDILLERILSLIPKNENGSFRHGAKKEFAESIGLKSGNLVSDWINGRSSSYTGYVYQISSKYNVSVEWLRGESEQKEKPTPEGELDEKALDMLLERMTIAELQELMGKTAAAMAKRAQNG